MQVVPPRLAWEIPVHSDALVASALARARPRVLAQAEPRLDGLSDAVVDERYRRLRAGVWARARSDATVLARLGDLELSDPETSWTRWQTSVATSDADDDVAAIEAARAVWEALGPNAYALQFTDRPRTFRGFLEGRAWSLLAVLGCIALIFGAITVDEHVGFPWWLWLPAVAGWPVLVWRLFRGSYGRRAGIGAKELPHL